MRCLGQANQQRTKDWSPWGQQRDGGAGAGITLEMLLRREKSRGKEERAWLHSSVGVLNSSNAKHMYFATIYKNKQTLDT